MTDLNKIDMAHIWASTGDRIAPDDVKIDNGWGIEVPTHQEINWQFNRLDNNVAYLMQKGFPEWDASTQYVAGKSYVQHLGVVYKATQTGENKNPATESAYWVVAFGGGSGGPLDDVVGYDGAIPYFTSPTDVSTVASTEFGRSVIGATNTYNLVDTVNTDYPSADKFGDSVIYHTFFGGGDGDYESYRLIGIGDCGITGTTLVPLSGDLNTLYTHTGKFLAQSDATNLPSGWSEGYYAVEMSGGYPNRCVQTIKGIGSGREASRTYTGTSWTPWVDTTSTTTSSANTIVRRDSSGGVSATNFYGGGSGITDISADNITSGTLAVEMGGTGATTATGTGSVVRSTSPTLGGVPLTPTAAAGTNTTQIASCAFVQTTSVAAAKAVMEKPVILDDDLAIFTQATHAGSIVISNRGTNHQILVPLVTVYFDGGWVEYEFYHFGPGTVTLAPETGAVSISVVGGSDTNFVAGQGCRLKCVATNQYIMIRY